MDKFRTPVLAAEQALKLGIFGINVRGGVTLADVEGNVQGTWDENVRLATWADHLDLHAAGIDGLALSWPDFDEGLQQLEDVILPRLVQAGLRRALEPQRQAARMRSA